MRLFFNLLYRNFSTNTTLPNLSKIPYKKRSIIIQQAQEILTDYFHSTRALPFTYAERISKNSINSLSELISKVQCKSDFPKSFLKFIRYNPINEFAFFYESIGIDYANVVGLLNLKPNVHFFADDSSAFNVACALAGFGFPWEKLGRLYEEEVLIFEKKPEFLSETLVGLQEFGFSSQQAIGVCLAFPCVLKEGVGVGLSGGNEGLLDDLKRVFVGFGFWGSVEGNVDTWYEACRKVKLFYDLGVEKGSVGEMMAKSKKIFMDCSCDDMAEKIEFFCRLGARSKDVGVLLLRYPEIFSIEFDNRVISLFGFLKHIGLQTQKLKSVADRHPYVFGRHKMVNLPNVLKAMEIHEWFFNRIKCGYYELLATYDLDGPDDGVDEDYVQNLEKIKCVRTYSYSVSKLDFLHGIGFGENRYTVKLLASVHGSASDLQERFDLLIHEGIRFSKLCEMLYLSPKILNQETDSLRKKLDFFREEIGLPLEYLVAFPGYLMYNLEKRVKPRYRFHVWLTEQGWCKKKYTLASIIAVSQKGFLAQLSCIHPSAPQLWLERCGKQMSDA